MEYSQIKQLMDDMGNSKLNYIDIEFPDGIKIKMEKREKEVIVTENSNQSENRIVKTIENETPCEENSNNEIKEEGNIVKSPMVGTFYIKSSPDANPYVEVGSCVKKGTVLCIIEAMKLMNEIESEYDGKIAEILVKDGEMVEYGKPLFRIV